MKLNMYFPYIYFIDGGHAYQWRIGFPLKPLCKHVKDFACYQNNTSVRDVEVLWLHSTSKQW